MARRKSQPKGENKTVQSLDPFIRTQRSSGHAALLTEAKLRGVPQVNIAQSPAVATLHDDSERRRKQRCGVCRKQAMSEPAAHQIAASQNEGSVKIRRGICPDNQLISVCLITCRIERVVSRVGVGAGIPTTEDPTTQRETSDRIPPNRKLEQDVPTKK